MKHLILGLALVGCAFACKTEKNASISDPNTANMPKVEGCTEKSACCQDKAKAGGACCAEKAKAEETKPQN